MDNEGHPVGPTVLDIKLVLQLPFRAIQLYIDFDANLEEIFSPSHIRELRASQRLIYLHAPYRVTACHGRSGYPGKRNFDFIVKLLRLSKPLRCRVVIHCGYSTNGGSLDKIVDFCNHVHNESSRRILLENSCGSRNSLGSCDEDLEYLAQHLDLTKVGFCLDTAHTFASGLIDLRTHDQAKLGLSRYRKLFKGIDLVHLNDTEISYSGGVDKHANLTTGFWSKKVLIRLVNRLRLWHIPIITETPDGCGDAEKVCLWLARYGHKPQGDS
jgi:deoxyribonuclease-4